MEVYFTATGAVEFGLNSFWDTNLVSEMRNIKHLDQIYVKSIHIKKKLLQEELEDN